MQEDAAPCHYTNQKFLLEREREGRGYMQIATQASMITGPHSDSIQKKKFCVPHHWEKNLAMVHLNQCCQTGM